MGLDGGEAQWDGKMSVIGRNARTNSFHKSHHAPFLKLERKDPDPADVLDPLGCDPAVSSAGE